MYKKDAIYHYGIKKHTYGDSYENDCWVLDSDYRPLNYIYKASAIYMRDQLNKIHYGRAKFYVVRYD